MNTVVIPLLEWLYLRMQKGLTRRQTVVVALLGIALLITFMFRAGCPPERRFLTSPTSQTIALCASPDMVRRPVPLGASRNATSPPVGRHPSVL